VADQVRVTGQAGFGQCAAVAQLAFAGARNPGRAVQHQDAPAAALQQVTRGQKPRPDIVRDHIRAAVVFEPPADQHIGDTRLPDQRQVVPGLLGRAEDQAVHAFARGRLDRRAFDRFILVGVHDQGAVASGKRLGFDRPHPEAEMRIGHVAQDHGHGAGAPRAQGTGDRVGDVAHLPGLGPDDGARGGRDVRQALQGVGNGVDRKASRFGDIAQTDLADRRCHLRAPGSGCRGR